MRPDSATASELSEFSEFFTVTAIPPLGEGDEEYAVVFKNIEMTKNFALYMSKKDVVTIRAEPQNASGEKEHHVTLTKMELENKTARLQFDFDTSIHPLPERLAATVRRYFYEQEIARVVEVSCIGPWQKPDTQLGVIFTWRAAAERFSAHLKDKRVDSAVIPLGRMPEDSFNNMFCVVLQDSEQLMRLDVEAVKTKKADELLEQVVGTALMENREYLFRVLPPEGLRALSTTNFDGDILLKSYLRFDNGQLCTLSQITAKEMSDFDKFKATYCETYAHAFFKSPFGMATKLKRGAITTMEEVKAYAAEHPTSRTAQVLTNMKRLRLLSL